MSNYNGMKKANNVMLPCPLIDSHRLRWERGTRYYEAHLARDLFGDWVLTRVWGQRNSPLGKVLHTPCTSHDNALSNLSKIATRRRAHGYTSI